MHLIKLFLTDVPISSTVVVYPDSFLYIRTIMKLKIYASFPFRTLRQMQVHQEEIENLIHNVKVVTSFTSKL